MAFLGAFLFSFLASLAATHLLLKVPVRSRFVDVPSERSSHDVVKPRLGGIAIFSSFCAVFAFLVVTRPAMDGFLPLFAGGALVFVAGVLDDRRSLPVAVRLAVQFAAAMVLVLSGNVVDHVYIPLVGTIELDMLAAPFTVLFTVASINFFNFIDGIDGLAAGSAAIVSGFLALIAFMLGHGTLALVCLAVSGASLGFLQFNFPPSRIFMGDGGSTFLGFFFAFAAARGNRLAPELPFFVTVLLLSSLYLDAGVTLLRRLFRGEKVLQPHKTHYYQRLLALGFNHKQVTVLEYALTVLLGVSAVIFFRAGEYFSVFLCVSWLLVFTSLMLKVRGLERGDRMFWERRTVLVVASDVLLVGVAYFSAFFLRLGFQVTGDHWDAVTRAFPIVLVVRSSCFYWYGLYRGVWKYTSTPDIVRIIKAVTVGSAVILMLLVFFYRFEAFPRSMFVMEYFLLILGLSGTRFASRLFHEFGKDALSGSVKRVAIVGAGDAGEQLLREVRASEGKSVAVVCFIDDDRGKDGLTLQGVPITGPTGRMAEICRRYRVDAVLVGLDDPSVAESRSAVEAAQAAGVEIQRRTGGANGVRRSGTVDVGEIARGLKRRLPMKPSEAARRFYRGKHVLVTHGGEFLGPALVEALAGMGAEVTVHAASPRERERFSSVGSGHVTFFVGNLDREVDAFRLFDAARPQVVFHALPLRAEGIANETAYVFRRGPRSCEALGAVAGRGGVESFVVVSLWESARPADAWALLSALCEVIVLNDPHMDRASPTVVRLPSVLTETTVRRIAAGDRESAVGRKRFDLLEAEAIAVILNAGAVCGGRSIVVPAASNSFDAEDIERIIAGRASPDGAVAAVFPEGRRPVFEKETPRPSLVPGAEQIVGPLCPAGGELLGALAGCARRAALEDYEECLRVLDLELGRAREVSGTAGPREG